MNDFLPISGLQHYAYCPRQFALIHVEKVWVENHFTAEGRIVHERVDSGERETRGELHYERGVAVVSHALGIIGKMDLLEIEMVNSLKARYFPVEYKRGTPKIDDWDRIQLCAQALCLEEMLNVSVTEGAIWYWQVRKREKVGLDRKLRKITIEMIDRAKRVWRSNKMPAPVKDKAKCRGCSLVDICQPEVLRNDRSEEYIEELFGT